MGSKESRETTPQSPEIDSKPLNTHRTSAANSYPTSPLQSPVVLDRPDPRGPRIQLRRDNSRCIPTHPSENTTPFATPHRSPGQLGSGLRIISEDKKTSCDEPKTSCESSQSPASSSLLERRAQLKNLIIEIPRAPDSPESDFSDEGLQSTKCFTRHKKEEITSCAPRLGPRVTGLKLVKDEDNRRQCRPHLILRAVMYPMRLREHLMSTERNQIKLVFKPTESCGPAVRVDSGKEFPDTKPPEPVSEFDQVRTQWEARIFSPSQDPTLHDPLAVIHSKQFLGVRKIYHRLVKRAFGQELNAHIIPDPNDECAVIKIGLEQILHWTRGKILALVNVKSGGLLGAEMMDILQGLRIPSFSHQKVSSKPAELKRFIDTLDKAMASRTKDYGVRILSCGGDGTSTWSLEILDQAFSSHELQHYFEPDNTDQRLTSPKMVDLKETKKDTARQIYCSEGAPLFVPYPLGSGNDICRVLGWGHSTPPFEHLGQLLLKLCNNRTMSLVDRWEVNILDDRDEIIQQKHMMNYMSIGYDADIVYRYMEDRKRNPEKYTTAWKNNWGHVESAIVRVFKPFKALKKQMKIKVDGEETVLSNDETTLCICNIPSIAKGMNYWGRPGSGDDFNPAMVGDGKLEVMAVRGLVDTILIRTGAISYMRRVAQPSKIELEFINSASPKVMIDGEAYDFGPAMKKLVIRHLTSHFALIGDPDTCRGCSIMHF